MQQYYKILTIAGSDSGGGAGIQADLKTIAACGGYGMSAITAITAQNTVGVQAIEGLSISIIKDQIRSVVQDIGTDAIKIGMLHSQEVIESVVEMIEELHLSKIILDPVMVATSGDQLLQKEAVHSLKTKLIPKADLVTPNIPEAEVLLDIRVDADNIEEVSKILAQEAQTSILLKGGHLNGKDLIDVLYDFNSDQFNTYKSKFINTANTHGTGCSLSSAIATFYGKGLSLREATEEGINFVKSAIEAGKNYKTGNGTGPIHHFYKYW